MKKNSHLTGFVLPESDFMPTSDRWSWTPSRYGAYVEVPGPEWVALPSDFAGTDWADASEYAEAMAAALLVRQREITGGRIPDALQDRVADQIRATYAQVFDVVPAHYHLLYWPDLLKPPIPVFLGAWEPEQDIDSARLMYAGTWQLGPGMQMPIREDFSSEALGSGVRVVRFVPLNPDEPRDPAAVLGVLAYHWRTEEPAADVQLVTFTNELGLLYDALTDLDSFARSIVLTDDTGV